MVCVALTMILANCSGLLSRPSVSIGNWKAGRAAPAAGRFGRPGASRFWLRIALATSMAVMLRDSQFLRIEPGPDAVVALALVADIRNAVDPQQFVFARRSWRSCSDRCRCTRDLSAVGE